MAEQRHLHVLYQADGPKEAVAQLVVEKDPLNVSTPATETVITLARADYADLDIEHPDSNAPAIYQPKPGVQTILTGKPALAVAYFLYTVETFGSDQREAEEHVPDGVLNDYFEWVGGLSTRDRKLRLFDLLDYRIDTGGDWAAEPYKEVAAFRDRGLDDSQRKLAERIEREVDIRTKLCYYTAQNAVLHHYGNHRIEYAEGVALPKQAAQVSRHAWIEIDGQVVELTWPWHNLDGGAAQYLGTTFSQDEVKAARDRREMNGALILDDDEVEELVASSRSVWEGKDA
jgi:hypothetical protein